MKYKRGRFEGFFNFYYSEKEDKIYLEVRQLDKEFLYVNSLSNGIRMKKEYTEEACGALLAVLKEAEIKGNSKKIEQAENNDIIL